MKYVIIPSRLDLDFIQKRMPKILTINNLEHETIIKVLKENLDSWNHSTIQFYKPCVPEIKRIIELHNTSNLRWETYWILEVKGEENA